MCLQHAVEQYKRRYIPHLENPQKDNQMSIIQKRIGNEFRYVTSYGQQRYIAQKMQHKLIDYVYGQVSVAGETLIAMTY